MARSKYIGILSLISGCFICAISNDASLAISNSNLSSSHIALTFNAGEGLFSSGISTHTIYVRKGISWSRVAATAPEKYIKGSDITYAKHKFDYWTYTDEATHKPTKIINDYIFNTNMVLDASYEAEAITITLSAYDKEDEATRESHGSFDTEGTKTKTISEYKSGVKYSDIKNKLPVPDKNLDEGYSHVYYMDKDGKQIEETTVFKDDVTLYSHYAVNPGVTDNFCNDNWSVLGDSANHGLEYMATTEEHSGGYKNAYEATEWDYYDEATEEWDTIHKKANTFVGLRRFVKLYETGMNPITVPVRVIGENVDVIDDGKSSRKTTLTFEFEKVLHGAKVYDTFNYDNDYRQATIKNYSNNDIKNALPTNLVSCMQKVIKPTHGGGAQGHIDNSNQYINKVTGNYLFIPSLMEKGYYKDNPSTEQLTELEGVGNGNKNCYEYYRTDNGRPDANKLIMTSIDGKAVDYWTRSPDVDTDCFVWSIDSTGNIGSTPSDVACGLGLDLCFCVGADTSSRSVTFDVTTRNANGKWSDGSTANKIIDLEAGKSFSDAVAGLKGLTPSTEGGQWKWTNKWFTASSGDTTIDNATIIDSNITVYADFSTAESVSVAYEGRTGSFTWTGGDKAYIGSNYETTFTPKSVTVSGKTASLYSNPSSIDNFTITSGETKLDPNDDYTYDASKGKLTITTSGVSKGNPNGLKISFVASASTDTNLWDTLAAIAAKDESNQASGGTAGDYTKQFVSVGDVFKISYGSGTNNYEVRLIDIAHSEDVINGTTTKAAMTFEFTSCVGSCYWYNQSPSDNDKKKYCYKNSILKTEMESSYGNINNNGVNGSLKSNIKKVNKRCLESAYEGKSGNVTVNEYSYHCFALSTYEYGGWTQVQLGKITSMSEHDGVSYKYYEDCVKGESGDVGYSKMIKNYNSQPVNYWTRSGVITKNSGGNNRYPTVFIKTDGSRNNMSESSKVFNDTFSDYYAPAFCL